MTPSPVNWFEKHSLRNMVYVSNGVSLLNCLLIFLSLSLLLSLSRSLLWPHQRRVEIMNVCWSAIISLDEKHIHLMENLKRAALLVSRLQQFTTHCNMVELTGGKHKAELVLGWAKFDMKKKWKLWYVTTTYINDQMITFIWCKGKVILKILNSWWVAHISSNARGSRDTVNGREKQLSVSTDTMMSALRSLWVQFTLHC